MAEDVRVQVVSKPPCILSMLAEHSGMETHNAPEIGVRRRHRIRDPQTRWRSPFHLGHARLVPFSQPEVCSTCKVQFQTTNTVRGPGTTLGIAVTETISGQTA